MSVAVGRSIDVNRKGFMQQLCVRVDYDVSLAL